MSDHSGSGYVLAFDFGLRHIGVASGQTVTGTATPLTTLRARDGKPDWAAVLELVGCWQPLCLLVGLPLNMDDTESDMSERARDFAAALERRSGIGTALVDERLTSREAREHVRPRARSQAGERAGSHALAAVLIAETWLHEHG